MNADLAQYILGELKASGVEELCVCPGGRNAPFIELLPGDFRVTWHFEERSAAFFALGRIKATGKPVGVITTSGTAAGELLPAAMEAHFSGLPLVLVTADRPVRFRGSGAPQAAYQEGIYGVYTPAAYDLANGDRTPPSGTASDELESGVRSWESEGQKSAKRVAGGCLCPCDELTVGREGVGSQESEGGERPSAHLLPLTIHPASPTHINVCFEDPQAEGAGGRKQEAGIPETVPLAKPVLRGQAIAQDGGQETVPLAKPVLHEQTSDRVLRLLNPFVIVGALAPDERPDVLEFLLDFPGTIYCESLSGLRETPELKDRLVRVADGIFQRADPAFDGVLRLGGVPTHRLWRDLEDKYAHLPVVSVSRLPFSGLGRESELLPLSLGQGLAATWLRGEYEGGLRRDSSLEVAKGSGTSIPTLPPVRSSQEEGLRSLLAVHPDSEPGLVWRLSERIDLRSNVFLGNSLPIREWDLAATFESRGFEMLASRGLNGIDGQVSTFLGTCTPDRANWALLGDLTTLYDLAGPWPIAQLDPGIAATIVVLNNGGGRIFDRMFKRPEFQNEHTKHFEAWAALWGLEYQRTTDPAEIPPLERGVRIVELVPNADATKAFWTAFDEALK